MGEHYWVRYYHHQNPDQVGYLPVISNAGGGRALTMARDRVDAKYVIDVAIPGEELEPCSGCVHQNLCFGNPWNQQRAGENQTTLQHRISDVHTCLTCGVKTLNTFDMKGGKRVVPDECPRWNPVSGSALDCNGCDAERQELKKAHRFTIRR